MAPVAASKLVEPWLVSVLIIAAGCVLLDDRKTCSQNVEISASAIFDLDVILDHVVGLNLLDTSVDTKTVVLVNNIVAYLKVSKVGDLLAAVLALFLFLLPCVLGEDITLRNDCELDVRILKALHYPAVIGHDLAGLQDSTRILAVKGADKVVAKVLNYSLCPCS